MSNSCRKDIDEIIPGDEVVTHESSTFIVEAEEEPEEILGNINDFFADSQVGKQSSLINSNTINIVYGNKGTLLNIPSSIFQTTEGVPVSGMVDIELIEIFYKDEMVRSNKPTTSNGAILISGGELYIMAYQNGEELEIIPGESMMVRVPAVTNYENPWEMTKFYGEEMPDGTVDWTIDPNAQVQLTEAQDSTAGTWGLAFEFPETRLGWINCDYFMGEENLTSLSLEVGEGYTNENTAAFLIFTDIHSVCRLSSFDESTHRFVANGSYSIPVGESVVAFTVSKSGDEYEADFVPITVSADLVIPIEFEAMSLEEIHSQLLSY